MSESKLSPEVIDHICQAIDTASDELRRLNLEIYNNPETKYEEFKAFKLLTTWFESQGWTVKRSVYDIETAFEARFTVGEGGRTVAYNAEYDALPKIGHACGHNLIATSTLASALGTAAALRHTQTAGTVLVVGTPAEETGGGKYYMALRGAWRDAHACLMTHPMPDFSTPVCATKASWKFRAYFRGRSAHAAAAPWEGRNACDAIVGAYEGIARLRQHLNTTKDGGESVQGVILKAGEAPNVVPDYAEGTFSIRARNTAGLHRLRERVEPVFTGAAAAAGCEVELCWDALYEDVVTNVALAGRYREYMLARLGMSPDEMVPLDEAARKHEQNGSSDMGNVTYVCPGIQPMFRIDAAGPPHTPKFQEAAGTVFAHEKALQAGKANALVGYEVLVDDGFYGEVRAEWEEAMKRAGREIASSLAACLRCRRLKVKCAGPASIPCQRCKSSGADCQFVQPRAITRAATGPDDAQSDRFARLETQLARLTDVVEGMRAELTSKPAHRSYADRPEFSNLAGPWQSSASHQDLVARGLITDDECVQLFETFLSQCNDTVAIFDGIPETLDVIRQEPILLAAVCAVGSRASSSREADLHQKCLTEARSLISSVAFGPAPSLLALRGIMLICAWYRSDRLWGTVITLAYEMGLHEDALRLPDEAKTMDRDEIERARTWLSILTYEMMANTSRPYLVESSQRYTDLARHLTLSPFSRPVDQRIMAYLELFKIIVEGKNNALSDLSMPEQEAQLVALNAALDTWFHRVHNSIDPLYQTFSKPQDRNRLVIPYAFARLYINGRVIDGGTLSGAIHDSEHFALAAVNAAVDAAFLLLSTAFDSKALAQSLCYTIDYSSMTLTAALSFLRRVVALRQATGLPVNVPAIAEILERARDAFENARAFSHAEWTKGLIEECVSAC
ncbi:Peptidase M20 domain-containing protein 2 [Lasiodiplodia theobromae]|uniref:Peptidase M20 domain-containing protein 2 n=1 Tax=Lasiodiplodia theobromae TaxID=45133 RepID=A0A5N5CWG0_9PEZI|nr:Peptidase M20 domain-containing protein 2 [Lasiodiplodia theobromae]